MRALKGAIPRGLRDHRTADGRRYAAYVRDVAARLFGGRLPAGIQLQHTLREAGRLDVELERLAADLEAAYRRKRRGEANRIRRQQFMLREQLLRLERRLEELAKSNSAPKTPMQAMADAPELG